MILSGGSDPPFQIPLSNHCTGITTMLAVAEVEKEFSVVSGGCWMVLNVFDMCPIFTYSRNNLLLVT